MNCQRAQHLLSVERDRPLTANEQTELAHHLGGCAGCAQLRQDLAAGAQSWREVTAAVPIPDAAEEWRRFQQRLDGRPTVVHHRPRPAIRTWAAFPLAVAAAVALILWIRPSHVPEAAMVGIQPRAEFVETNDRASSTLVYVDEQSGWLVVWAPTTPRVSS